LYEFNIFLIADFAANYITIADEIARVLLDDFLSIDSDYQKLRQSYLAKFRNV